MDPITHALVGMAAGSFSGSGSVLSNPLALGCLIGSVLPDSDIIYQYWGDYAYLKNHRGITHSIPGMAALSAVVSLIVHALFPGTGYLAILLWTFLGCLTHVGLDVFNSYGAKVFWPFIDKKIGTGLLLVFDPFLVACAAVVYWFNRTHPHIAVAGLGGFVLYLLFRQYRKSKIRKALLCIVPSSEIDKVVLLPSMSGFFRWDFIIHCTKEILTGSVDTWGRDIRVRDRLIKTDNWITELVMDTKLGQFFKDFSQEYHISCEVKDDHHTVTLTDLRYYMRNRYMHHAVAQFNHNLELTHAAFHPYHDGRNARLPKAKQTA